MKTELQRRRAFSWAPLAGVLAGVAACGDSDRVRVLDRDESPHAPAVQLAATVSRAAEGNPSPSAYRDLAVSLAEIRPFGSSDLEARAERSLVFLALPRLAAVADEPVEAQADALALTVWPTALEVEPEPGEEPAAYLERACGDELARHCKHVVPNYRPLVVSELAWRRFKGRARSAHAACRPCRGESSYEEALAAFHDHQSAVSARRAELGGRERVRSWPKAGDNARPWPKDAPLLSIAPRGEAYFRANRVDDGAGWRTAIADGRDGAEQLRLHLRPTDDVALVREVIRFAAEAGYRDVALAAVSRDYPYAHKAYVVAARERDRGEAVRVRDVDTVQVLVQAIDATLTGPDRTAQL